MLGTKANMALILGALSWLTFTQTSNAMDEDPFYLPPSTILKVKSKPLTGIMEEEEENTGQEPEAPIDFSTLPVVNSPESLSELLSQDPRPKHVKLQHIQGSALENVANILDKNSVSVVAIDLSDSYKSRKKCGTSTVGNDLFNLQAHPDVKHMNLSSRNVTDRDLQNSVIVYPLSVLDLSNNPNITKAGLEVITQYFHALTHLNLDMRSSAPDLQIPLTDTVVEEFLWNRKVGVPLQGLQLPSGKLLTRT